MEPTNKPSKLDNFKGKRHEFTREDASKGGQTKTRYRLNMLKLSKIKQCNLKCPIYPCRYQPLSEAKYEKRCALKNLEPSTRRKYLNLVFGGEDELFTEATNAVMSIEDGFKTVSAIEKIHKMRFGEKVKNEVVNNSFVEEMRSYAEQVRAEKKNNKSVNVSKN